MTNGPGTTGVHSVALGALSVEKCMGCEVINCGRCKPIPSLAVAGTAARVHRPDPSSPGGSTTESANGAGQLIQCNF